MVLRKAVKDWREQNIAPVFKKGSKDEPGSYRPISLLSLPGKMLESITANSVVSHLDTNGLILDNPHEFFQGRSCPTNVLDI